MMNRDEYRQLLLAGSVTFPATYPQLGRLTLSAETRPGRPSEQLEVLSVEEFPSPRVTLARRVPLGRVRAVFLPRDPSAVHFSDGQWLLEDEIGSGLKQRLSENAGSLLGIVFVPENEPSMLHVSAGMTAAESSQYYPPLPNDPSHNHYNPWPSNRAVASQLGQAFGSVPSRACSAADDATIFMQACTSMDPLCEIEMRKAMSIGSGDRMPVAAAGDGQSLISSCTVSHVGLAPRTVLDAQPHAAAFRSIEPFPTDDLSS